MQKASVVLCVTKFLKHTFQHTPFRRQVVAKKRKFGRTELNVKSKAPENKVKQKTKTKMSMFSVCTEHYSLHVCAIVDHDVWISCEWNDLTTLSVAETTEIGHIVYFSQGGKRIHKGLSSQCRIELLVRSFIANCDLLVAKRSQNNNNFGRKYLLTAPWFPKLFQSSFVNG